MFNNANFKNRKGIKSQQRRERSMLIEALEVRELLSISPLFPDISDGVPGLVAPLEASENLAPTNEIVVDLPEENLSNPETTQILEVADDVYYNGHYYNANDYTRLRTFLQQTDGQGVKNGSKMSNTYVANAPTTWAGVTWWEFDGVMRVTEIDFDQKKLWGELDVSGCTELEYMRCRTNAITALNASGCTALTELFCGGSPGLTSVNVSGCTSLKKLLCPNDGITSLNLSGCKALTILGCGDNKLTSLDVSEFTELSTLSCFSNQLTSLDVSKNTALSVLGCESNQITTLNLSNNTSLTDLTCWNSTLNKVVLSTNRLQPLKINLSYTSTLSWEYKDGNGNSLGSYDCTLDTTTTLPVYGYGTPFANQVNTTTQNVSFIAATPLSVPSLNINSTSSNTVSISVGSVSNASGYTLLYSTNSNFSNATAKSVSAGTSTISGLEANTTYYFRVMANANGSGTYCNSNYSAAKSATTSAIQLSAPTLSVSANGSDSISVTVGAVSNASGYTLQYSTNSSFSNATTKSVSEGTTTISGLSANTTYYFRVMATGSGSYSNSNYSSAKSVKTASVSTKLSIPEFSVNANYNYNSATVTVGIVSNASGYTLQYSTNSDFSNATTLSVSSGNTTITNLSANTTYYFRVKALGTGNYTDSDYSVAQSASFFYNSNDVARLRDFFEQTNSNGVKNGVVLFASRYDVNNPGTWTVLDGGERFGVTWSMVNGERRATKLALNYGTTSGSLNLSGCSALTSLIIDYYQTHLTSLNVSGCTALIGLSCGNNQLTSLNVSGCTAMTSLSCGFNQLTSLNLSGCTALSSLSCSGNQLTSLNLSGCTALSSLSCYNNQIASLNLSGNPALESLTCHGNQLTSLDLSNNTALTSLECWNSSLNIVVIPAVRNNNLQITQKNSTNGWTLKDANGNTIGTVPYSSGSYTLSPSTSLPIYATVDSSQTIVFSDSFQLSVPYLTVSASGSNAISVTVGSVANASGYTLQYSTNLSFTNAISLNVLEGTSTVSGLNANTTYYFRLMATGSGNYSNSDYCGTQSVKTSAIALTTPTLTVIASGSDSVSVTVGSVANATGYTIQYSTNSSFSNATTKSVSAGTSTISGLNANMTYYFHVMATGSGSYSNSDYSATKSATTSAIKLATPSLAVSVSGSNAVSITVGSVAGASGYTLQYSTSSSFSNATTTSVSSGSTTISGLNANTTYYFRVMATGSGNYSNSDYSGAQSVKTNTIELTTPTLTVSASGSDSVSVTVGSVSNASGYTIQYSTNSNFSNATTKSVSTGTSTVSGLNANTTYYFRVMATGSGSYSNSDYSGAQSVTTSPIKLTVPSLTVSASGSNAVFVTVGSVSYASGYSVQYSTNSDFSNAATRSVSAGTSTISGLSANTTYYFRVMATGSGTYSNSDYSATKSATTSPIKLTAPTLTLSASGSDSISVTVGSVANASGYSLQYSTSSNFSNATTQPVLVGTSTVNGLNANTTYYFRVMATGSGTYSNSDYSGTQSSTTNAIKLSAPTLTVSASGSNAVFVTVGSVSNASGYSIQYSTNSNFSNAVTKSVSAGSSTVSGLSASTTYYFRVMATGSGSYSNSDYSGAQSATTSETIPPTITINNNKVTVSWEDGSPAADSIRYRVVGSNSWKTQKLRAGVTMYSFNGAAGTSYEIEVLLDQQEFNTLKTTAVVLDQPKLSSVKTSIKDDAFQVSVTNYYTKNLATNATQAILTVNGAQTTLDILNQQGIGYLTSGGQVKFNNGVFTFTEMASNTSNKIQISFSDGNSVSKASSALTVKTTKTCYQTPVITSAVATSDTSINVTWETAYGKNSTVPAQKYTVQYSTDGVKWTNATTSATGNSFTIQKLKGGVEYNVRVLATKDNLFNASSPSNTLTAETLTLPKVALDKTSVTDESFKLNVTNYQNSNLDQATILNVKSDKFGTTAIALQNGTGTGSFANGMTVAFENGTLTFTNVPSATQQKIQINFSDGVCTTAWSSALTVKTLKAAYNKPVLTSAVPIGRTNIEVNWETTYGKNSTIPAQKYTVQYSVDGVRWINATTSATGTRFTIMNLKPNTSYLVAVIANKDSLFNASLPSDSQLVTTGH